MTRACGAAATPAWVAAGAFVVATAPIRGNGVAGVQAWPIVERLAVLAPLALVAAAFAWSTTRRPGRSVLASSAAVCWQLARFAGSGDVPGVVRGIGWYAAAVLVPCIGLLVEHRRQTAWLITGIAGVVWAATYDPFLDPRCTSYCAANRLTVRSVPELAEWLVVATGVGAATLLLWAIVAGLRERQGQRLLGAMLLAGATLAPGLQAHGHLHVARALISLGSLAPLLLAVTPVHAAFRRLRGLAALRRLASATSAGASSSLEDGLRVACGDATLTVAYEQDDGGLLRADGEAWTPSGRPAVRLVDHGRTVAVIEHDGSLDPYDLRAAFGSSARLAAWNEGLDADLRYRLASVRESRRRLVEAEDRERRHLERDLHDGVQQRLLGLLFELRLTDPGDGTTQEQIDRAYAHIGAALLAVRDIAAGTYPTVIEQSGLAAGLHTVVERGKRPVVLRVDIHDGHSLTAAVGRTIHDAVQAVAHEPTAQPAEVTIETIGEGLRLVALTPGWQVPASLRDRIVALGGHVESSIQGWECWLPCA